MTKHTLVVLVSAAALTGCLASKGEDQACAQYCDLMEENCPSVGFSGGATEHDRDACLAVCEGYDDTPVFDDDGNRVELGKPVPDDDSLACRMYHANNASGNPGGVHCGHAGPSGAGTCVAFKSPCDQFCVGAPADPGTEIRADGFIGVVEFCNMAPEGPAFASEDDCAAFCNGIPAGNPDDVAGRTRYCFLNTILAAHEAMDQTQCVEASPDSTVCGGQ